jgi:hypothetical protein
MASSTNYKAAHCAVSGLLSFLPLPPSGCAIPPTRTLDLIFHVQARSKVVLVFNYAPHHEDLYRSGGINSCTQDLSTGW